VTSEAHADGDDQVWSPPGDGPIVNREVNGILVNLILRVVSRLGVPVGVLMPQWLRDSVNEQTDSDTSTVIVKKTKFNKVRNEQLDRIRIPAPTPASIYLRKYHGKEGCRRKLRRLVLMPQLNVAELDSDKDDKQEEDSSGADKKPSEVEGNLGTPIDEGLVRSFRVHHAPDCEAPKHSNTNTAYERVEGDVILQPWYIESPLANRKLFLCQ
jgi:hypothetical protein